METAQTIDTIRTVFSGFIIQTKISSDILVSIYLTEASSKLLTQFFISDEGIGIKSLNKQGNVSGTFILAKIEELARAIGAKSISLNDNSTLELPCGKFGVNISLAILYLLTHGISWYNSKGYVDKCMIDDGIPSYHHDLINTTMSEFIQKVIKELVKNQTFEYFNLNGKTFEDTIDSQGNTTNYMYNTFADIERKMPVLTLELKVNEYFAIIKSLLQKAFGTFFTL